MTAIDETVTVITGGGTGIGRAAALLFADRGSRVVVAGRRRAPLEVVANEIRGHRGEALAVVTDVSKSAQVERLLAAAIDTFGGIDNLVNNAALDAVKPLLETTEEDWDRVLDVNLKGHFLCARGAVPEMVRRGGGCIVNVSSVLGIASMRGVGAYCASKAGIIGLTRSMALEWTELGIRVNCVAPGSTETAMMWGDLADDLIPSRRAAEEDVLPIGRLADPAEIAEAIVWLCSPAASFVAGTTLVVDGAALTEYPAPRWSPAAPDAR